MRDNNHKSPPGHNGTALAGNAGAFPTGWTPLQAWRLHSLYAPVVHALKALLAASGATESARPQILQAGGEPGVLAALLMRAEGGPIECDVTMLSATPAAADKVSAKSYECVVAIDWLSLVAPSRRQHQLAALCRAARSGIVLLNPFDTPEAVTAQRTVNDGYRAAHAVDHPTLGHLIELGLPDLPTARDWIEPFFPHLETRPIEHITLWQMGASMAILEPESMRPPSPADIAAAAMYPLPIEMLAAEPAYRTLVVAAARPSPLAMQRPPVASAAQSQMPALAMVAALEAAEQRRTLARLVEAITAERERERDEFRAGVASLAGELREQASHAESLARETREQERTISNLRAMLGNAEARADAEAKNAEATEAHARNLATLRVNAEALTETAQTHARNLDSLRADAERRAGAAAARADAAETHARNFSALRAEAEARAAAAENNAREAHALRADAETRLKATELHARNLDAQRVEAERRAGAAVARADAAETHTRNLAAMRTEAEARAETAEVRTREMQALRADAETRLNAAETHARNLDALRVDAERHAAAAAARIDAAETHARNLDSRHVDAERRAAAAAARVEAAETHARNLDSLRLDAERRAATATARVQAAETHARNLDALRADAEQRAGAAAAQADAAETHARNLDALRVRAEQVHENFLRSRAGRAYASYTRMKRALTGRK